MPKIQRNISGLKLAKLLEQFDYKITRQKGSHIRLTSRYKNEQHNITIPAHNPIKIGTLNNILREIADYVGLSKEELTRKLF